MSGLLTLLVFIYIGGVFVMARRHYLAKHGIFYSRDTPLLTNDSTFIGVLWPVALFYEPWRNPALCRHVEHVEMRAQARKAIQARKQSYEQALREEDGR